MRNDLIERDHILLPVSPTFITISLLGAFISNLIPWGNWIWIPDFVAITLVFWSIYQPRKVGIGLAFLMGLIMDIHNATLLGENALSYTLLSYFAITIHKRVLWFKPVSQAIHVLPLFFLMQASQIIIQFLINGKIPSLIFFSKSFISILIWPIVCWVLLAPQRRAVDRDETRPI